MSLSAWAGDHGHGGGGRPGGGHRPAGGSASCGPGAAQPAQGGVIVGGFLGAPGGAYVGGARLGGSAGSWYGNTWYGSTGRYPRGAAVMVAPAYPYAGYSGYVAWPPFGSSAYGFDNPPSPPYPAEPVPEPREPAPQVVVEQAPPQIYLVPVPAPAPVAAPAPPAQPQPVVAPVPIAPPAPEPVAPRPSTGKGPDIFHWVDENGIENYSTSVPRSARGKAKKVNAELSEVSSSVDRH